MEKSNKDCTIREWIDSCDASKYLRTLWKKSKTGCARWLSLATPRWYFLSPGHACMSVRGKSLVRTQHMTSHRRLPMRNIPKVLLNVTDRTSVSFQLRAKSSLRFREELRKADRSHPSRANPNVSPWSRSEAEFKASQEVFLMVCCILANSEQSNHKCCRFHYAFALHKVMRTSVVII